MGYSKVDGVGPAIEEAHEKILDAVDKIEENQEKQEAKEKEMSAMDNIAGLLALMQNNKGMDLPGLLALCKEKGYNNGWGGEGMFMFVFLILFLFAGGGWGNLGRNGQDQFAQMAGGQTRDLIALYDKLGQMQSNNSNDFSRALQDNAAGFMQLDTKICSAIAETIAAVRNQGHENYNAIRNVGDAVRDCCCEMNRQITALGCKVDGLYGHTSVLQERTVNAIERGNCEIETKIAKLEAKMDLNFERTQCLITNTAAQQEKERLQRQVEELKAAQQGAAIAKETLAAMQAWTSQNYAFTRTATSPVVNNQQS